MEVHNTLGNGFQEVIYQRALAMEFRNEGLLYEREKTMTVLYKKRKVGLRRVDFIVEGVVMLELKAVSELDDAHLNQALNYLQVYQLEIGLLINFGSKSLQFKRLIHSNYKYNPDSSPLIG